MPVSDFRGGFPRWASLGSHYDEESLCELVFLCAALPFCVVGGYDLSDRFGKSSHPCMCSVL